MARTTSAVSRRQARAVLDARLSQVRTVQTALVVPHGGWIRAIRDALGMPAVILASKMGVVESTVHRLEASERAGTAQLDSLRRAADAMDCDVVYALVPRQPLSDQVDAQARLKAYASLVPVLHTMALEDQEVSGDAVARLIEEHAAEWRDRPGLWNVG